MYKTAKHPDTHTCDAYNPVHLDLTVFVKPRPLCRAGVSFTRSSPTLQHRTHSITRKYSTPKARRPAITATATATHSRLIMIRAQQPTHSRRRSHPATVVSYILSAVLSILLAATPACNAFFAAPPLGASTISTSSSAGGERHRGAVLPTVRGAGSRVRRVPLGMSAVDVEQMGIVTVYHKQTCPHCKKVGSFVCTKCVPKNYVCKHDMLYRPCRSTVRTQTSTNRLYL